MDQSSSGQTTDTRETIPGFSSLGFRVSPDAERIGRLLESAAHVSKSYPSAEGETLLCSDTNYRLWQKFFPDNCMPVLEGAAPAGMAGFCNETQAGPRVIAYIVDRMDQNGSDPIPVCFSSPHHMLGTPPPVDELFPLALSMLAEACLIFNTPEELAAHPNTNGWPTPAFAPVGLIDIESGEMRPEPTTHAFLTGKVFLSSKEENSLTGSHFWSLDVRTLYGDITVCLPIEALDADPVDKVIAVSGLMSGSVPHIIPEPITEEEDEERTPIDNERAEARIRELLNEYMSNGDFEMTYYEIHPSKLAKRLASGVGLFNKDIRDAAKTFDERRQLATPELRQRYTHAAATAPIVFAHIVMANTMAIENGQPSPALVVLAWGERGMETMAKVRTTLSRIHFDIPENEAEEQLAAEIADEEYYFGRRRRMPDWLTDGEECYAADLWLSAEALDEERLQMEIVLCIAEPGPNGLTMALPGKIIKQALNEARSSTAKPPPLPPRSTGATPPPLPPRAH